MNKLFLAGYIPIFHSQFAEVRYDKDEAELKAVIKRAVSQIHGEVTEESVSEVLHALWHGLRRYYSMQNEEVINFLQKRDGELF